MSEEKYISLIASGIPDEKINSIKSIVRHQGGPFSCVKDESVRRGPDGYSLQIVTPFNYSKRLADSIGLSGYASDVLPVGVSGVDRNYDIFM